MLATTLRALAVLPLILFSTVAFAQSANTGGDGFIGISGGFKHICAVEADGELNCNQASDALRLAPPENLPPLTAVEAGNVHACGLSLDGTAVCWGDNDFGQLHAPSDVQFTSLSAGAFHTCGITTSDQVECWGLNQKGQGEPRFLNSDFTINSEDPLPLLALDLAEDVSCGLGTDGTIHCWGEFVSSFNPISNVTNDPGDLTVESFAVDKTFPYSRQCGLLSDGTIECFSNNFSFDGLYTDLAGFGALMCALDLDGDLECQASVGDTRALSSAVIERVSEINAGDPLVSINGNVMLCGLTAQGAAVCMSRNPGSSFFPLGVPGSDTTLTPAPADFSAAIYSDTTIELIWSDRDIRPWEIAFAEIFRDGELHATTTQLRSYIDDTLEPGRSYAYQVRFVAITGQIGEFSSSINVDTLSRNDPTQPSVSGYNPPARPFEPTDLQASVYSQELLELQWSRVPNATIGYEIRRNGEYLAYTTGVSYLDATVMFSSDYVYEVIAVNGEGDMLGVAMIQVFVP